MSFRRWLGDQDGFVAIMFVLAMLATAVACVAGVAALLRAVMR